MNISNNQMTFGGAQPQVQMNFPNGSYAVIKPGNAQHQGARNYQEDSFGFSDISSSQIISQRGMLCMIADGMGGLANGKQASDTAVSMFLSLFQTVDFAKPISPQFIDIIYKINDSIYSSAQASGTGKSGTTFVGALIRNGFLHWVCVGDSRLYLIRNNRIYQINEDHDLINTQLVRCIEGTMTKQEIYSNPQKDALTDYLGCPNLKTIDSSRRGFPMELGDKIILCSDGVYNSISEADIISAANSYPPMEAATLIANTVIENNLRAQDNLTVEIISYE